MSFVLSKVLWIFLAPANVLLFLLGAGLALESTSRTSLKKTGRFLCFFVLFCFAMLAIFPVGNWALAPLENRFAFNHPKQVDGILILGGDENTNVSDSRGQPVALDAMRRFVWFKTMTAQYPNARLVYSGGSGLLRPNEHLTEVDVARDIMTRIGVPTNRVLFEKTSRNTRENALFSADLAHPKKSENWLLVTSAFHMPRAMGCFRQAGWNVYAAPTGYFTTGKYSLLPVFRFEEQLRFLTLAAHEYVGLVSYRLMGRTNALWPR
ncbi:MAG: YdcF family protein [Bdellovibrionales bacterium]|jgi:uncharacterized SAM-binding protein YcdF (DUF218 family)